jgi:DNA-directed RNA polymerase specialized sigma subunit
MEIEKGKTAKILRDKQGVSQQAKDNLKEFNQIKKKMLEALSEGEMTISQLSEKIEMPKDEVVYYLLTLVKYGFVQTGEVDDMDEYYNYKLKA